MAEAVFEIIAKGSDDSSDKDRKTEPADPVPSPSSKTSTITAGERKATPNTSDTFHPEGWLILMAVSLAVMLYCLRRLWLDS